MLLLAYAFTPPDAAAQTQFQEASLQNRQAFVDSAEISHRMRDLQAQFEWRRRANLPRFYIGTADHCVVVGRFCEWHPNIPDDDVPDEGKNIRRARAELLRDLQKASTAVPGDDWIIGQRIRYLVEGHDTTAISVARSCRATQWWCDALLGLALHVSGNFVAADSAFTASLNAMPTQKRCYWVNLLPLLDDDVRGSYKKMTCAQREAADARIWWIADPLFMTPGNERRTEHYARVVHTILQKDAVNTYGSSWGEDLAELILRFGWAEKWTREPSESFYPETKVNVTGHEREPGFHFFLTQLPPDTLAKIVDSLFDIHQFPPREQYAPTYARAFEHLDAQVARFRRGDSTRIVAAYDVSSDTIFARHSFDAALIAMGDEATTASTARMSGAPTRNVLSVSTPWKTQLIGVELLASDSAGAARWRSGFAEVPLDSAKVSVSDLLFVDAAASLPSNLEEATARAHGGTTFARGKQIGLFWELYGKTPTDSAVPVSLTITPVDAGFFKRAFRALRIAPKPTPLNIRWQENGASGVLSPRSVLLDLSLIPAGKYSVQLEVQGYPLATTSRTIEVK